MAQIQLAPSLAVAFFIKAWFQVEGIMRRLHVLSCCGASCSADSKSLPWSATALHTDDSFQDDSYHGGKQRMLLVLWLKCSDLPTWQFIADCCA